MYSCRAVVMLTIMAVSSQVAWAQSSDVHATTSDTGVTSGLSVVTGTVYDSTAHVPLANALVQMRREVGSHQVFAATTDSAGTYRIANVPPGRYAATFFHLRLDSLGLLPIAWEVDVNDTVTRSSFAVPSAATIWSQACRLKDASDSTGLVVGHVHDADTGTPLAGSVVSASWSELVFDDRGLHTERRQIAAATKADGLYALCGVPAGGGVLMRAEHGATSSGVVEASPPSRGLLVRDFGIGSRDAMVAGAQDSDTGAARTGDRPTVPHGTARLEGVIHAPDGTPLSDVDVLVYGSDGREHSDGRGHFVLTALPSGTYTLEARHVGFAPQRVIVDLSSHQTTSVTLTMYKPVAVLSIMHVYGKKRSLQRDLTGFLERQHKGLGYFLTRHDIEQKHAFHFTDLFREIPGVRVIRSGFGHQILLAGDRNNLGLNGLGYTPCPPAIYVDGVHIEQSEEDDMDFVIPIDDIAAMEIYRGPATAPSQYSEGKCGSIVIWTGLAP